MALIVVITCDVEGCDRRADCTWDNPPENDMGYPWGQWRWNVGDRPAGWVDDGYNAPDGWQVSADYKFVCPVHAR